MKNNTCIIIGFILSILEISSIQLTAQPTDGNESGQTIEFPDIPGFITLVCDFHQHTAFSDGSVWPDIRIYEALIEGLNAISITDHLEYQPHHEDIQSMDRNRIYQLASETARDKNLLVINGAEITRRMPPGHANAIFLKDVNRLLGIDSMEVFREAARQGAFVIWNHPHWYAQNPTGKAELTDLHRQLISEGLINGIEVVNEHTYSDEALQIALDNNLAIMGASDIHDLIDWQYNIQGGGHRPVTLVFARENSEKSLQEALINRRTVVWFDNTLIGRTDYLMPLLEGSIQVKSAGYMDINSGKSFVTSVDILNRSDADYILENRGNLYFYNHTDLVTLKAQSITKVMVKLPGIVSSFDLTFRVLNAVTAPAIHPMITIHVDITEP
jgi:3',5'-nucleoside bisphosphate phosphatase